MEIFILFFIIWFLIDTANIAKQLKRIADALEQKNQEKEDES